MHPIIIAKNKENEKAISKTKDDAAIFICGLINKNFEKPICNPNFFIVLLSSAVQLNVFFKVKNS